MADSGWDAMEIMHHRRLSRDLVAVESFRKHTRGLGPENMVTMRTLLMVEMIENLFGLNRLTFNHSSVFYLFYLQQPSTIRTGLPHVHRDDLIRRLFGVSFSSVARMAWTGSSLVILIFLIGIGFKG